MNFQIIIIIIFIYNSSKDFYTIKLLSSCKIKSGGAIIHINNYDLKSTIKFIVLPDTTQLLRGDVALDITL